MTPKDVTGQTRRAPLAEPFDYHAIIDDAHRLRSEAIRDMFRATAQAFRDLPMWRRRTVLRKA